MLVKALIIEETKLSNFFELLLISRLSKKFRYRKILFAVAFECLAYTNNLAAALLSSSHWSNIPSHKTLLMFFSNPSHASKSIN